MRGQATTIAMMGYRRALHKQDGGNNLSKPGLRTRRMMQLSLLHSELEI